MDQKTVLVTLKAIQDSVAQLDKEQAFYQECLCNCKQNSDYHEILTKKLSKISTQTKDLDSAYSTLCAIIDGEIEVNSNDIKYRGGFEDGEFIGVKIE